MKANSPPLPFSKLLLFGLSVLSSVLLALSLPNEIFPDGNAILGIVSLVPAFVAVSLAPTFGFASLLGVVFGAISTALTDFWLMFFQGYSIWTYGGVIIGYTGYNALLFPFLRGFSRIRPRYRPFLLAAAWAVYEYFKSVGFFGYPWGLVAYPVGDILPLIQFIDITGIWGLSFLMSLVNALIAEWVLYSLRLVPPWDGLDLGPRGFGARSADATTGRRDGRGPTWRDRYFFGQAAFGLCLVILALAYGIFRLNRHIPYDGTAHLLLVQQNIDPWVAGNAVRESARINEELTLEGISEATEPVDLVVWSEGSVSDVLVVNGNQFLPKSNSLIPYAQAAGTYTLFGGAVAFDLSKNQYMNGVTLISPQGKIIDTYGKMHPVPMAESIPFYELKPVEDFFRKVVGIWNPWVMGTRYTIFTVPRSSGENFTFGAPICFEDAFSDLCRTFILRGADMWLNLTNDYWSKTVSSEIQHFQVAKFRAVENRRILVRSTNGGVTVVVGPWGEVRASLPLFERGRLDVKVPVYKERNFTPYTLFGDYFPWCLAGLLLLLLFVFLFDRRHSV